MENNVSIEETNRDLSLLTTIEQNPDVSQATLADELGVAVGTINWYLKRLITKGYVKVKRAQCKKLCYIITPEGYLPALAGRAGNHRPMSYELSS